MKGDPCAKCGLDTKLKNIGSSLWGYCERCGAKWYEGQCENIPDWQTSVTWEHNRKFLSKFRIWTRDLLDHELQTERSQ